MAFAVLTFSILRSTRLFGFLLIRLPLSKILLLAVIAVFTPSLPEEVFYRVLLLPHPDEHVSLALRVLWGGVALLVFVAAHPLLAATAWPWSRRIFYRPAFLTIVALLGLVGHPSRLSPFRLYFDESYVFCARHKFSLR